MRTYRYDAVTNAFYPYELQQDYEVAGNWPVDGVDVGEDIFQIFLYPPSGKVRVPDKDGNPSWADIAPEENDVILTRVMNDLGDEYKKDISDLNAAYLSAIVSDGPSEVSKQQLVRDRMNVRKEQYKNDIADAKSKYPI